MKQIISQLTFIIILIISISCTNDQNKELTITLSYDDIESIQDLKVVLSKNGEDKLKKIDLMLKNVSIKLECLDFTFLLMDISTSYFPVDTPVILGDFKTKLNKTLFIQIQHLKDLQKQKIEAKLKKCF